MLAVAARWIGAVVMLGAALALPGSGRAENAPPYGLAKRVPWQNDRLVGSPEPPLPYTVEPIFTKHAWKMPLYIAPEPGSNRLWVVQGGDPPESGSRLVRIANDPESAEMELVLDLPRELLYSVCFHPDFERNGYFFVFCNGPRDQPDRRNRIIRYRVAGASRTVDPASAREIIAWESAGHDGGDMAFGNDGFMYISSGDGTSDSDTWNSGQTVDDLLGAILRIDVDREEAGRAYAVPADNPFVDRPDARPELWAYGLRNPWRMSYDRESGQLWVGSNGQDLWETAHLVRRGENYGWSVYEGSHPFYLERKRGPTPIVPPTIEHSHAEFRSLTGGVVYRGEKYPDLVGAYIYGDYSSGRIWAMKHDGEKALWHREIADTPLQIASFRIDRSGNLLITDHGSGFYRLVPAPERKEVRPFPTRLSETGLFASTAEHRPAPGVIPYSVNAPGWNDGAEAERFLAVPGEERVGFDAARGWTFPEGTALVQSLWAERAPGNPQSRVRIETRVMLLQQKEWAGYSYRWNDAQTDAFLVPKGGEGPTPVESVAGGPTSAWRFPSRSECMTCHSRAAGFVLGVTGAQLNRLHDYGGVKDNQLRALDHIGFFTSPLPKPPAEIERMVDPRDESADLEARVRAYLHVNCSVCHVEAGGGNAQMELGLATPREKMRLLEARPQHDTFGIPNAMLVAPGAPERSVLVHRMARRGPGQMPPLVTHRVDEQAVELMRRWIAGLQPARPFVRAWSQAELLALLERPRGLDAVERGKTLFREVGCAQCHKLGSEGGTVGPALDDLPRRLTPAQVVESLIEPGKVVADAYANTMIATTAGVVHTGRVEHEDERVVVLRPPPPAPPVVIPREDIEERGKVPGSNMPEGIINVLKEDEVADLLAYLLAGGTREGRP